MLLKELLLYEKISKFQDKNTKKVISQFFVKEINLK
jgi:hypothetical protein